MSELKKYGTFGGVFTPSILTILGVIMYMRMGTVVGSASSIWVTVAIVLFAHVVSITTGLSVSSVATDKKIKAGGIYYMLSRSLGFPIGGAIGLTLFVATALSIALYLVGFSESFLSVVGVEEVTSNHLRITGGIILVIVMTVAFISTSLAMKMQYFILAAIGISIISIAMGDAEGVERGKDALSDVSFATLFGIFFPAVTGFTAGVAMSGDLKNPKKAIPWGTMAAIGVGLLVYLGLAFFLYYSFDDLEVLATNNNAIVEFAWYGGVLVVAGIWGATLSSALGGILGAPRILQAMSMDKITPAVFGKGVGVNNEPRNALILTAIIAFAGVMIAELNLIARVVAMCYMTAYMFINLSCLLEQWSSPDFRPTFRISMYIPGIGAIATIILMIQLDVAFAIVAILLVAISFFWLAKKQLELGSGDVWNSVWSSVVKVGLKNLQKKSTHKRNWEPNILLFSGASSNRTHLIDFSKGIAGGNGMISNFDLIENRSAKVLFPKHQQTKVEVDSNEDSIFFRQQECQNIYRGVENIANSYGFSGIDPNTVLMGWGRNTSNPKEFAQMTDYLNQLDMNVLFLDYDKQKGFGQKKTLDIWWSHFAEYGDLSLHLTKLMLSSRDWSQINVRILYDNHDNSTSDYVKKIIESKCEINRVQAEIVVVNNEIERKSFYELVRKYSIDTDVIFLELPAFENHGENHFVNRTNELLHEIGTALIFRASSHFYEDINLDPSLQKEYEMYSDRIEFEKKSVDFVAQTTGFSQVDKVIERIGNQLFEAHQLYGEKFYNAFNESYGALSRVLEDIYNDPVKNSAHIVAAIDDFQENRIQSLKTSLQKGLKEMLLASQNGIKDIPLSVDILYPKEVYSENATDTKEVLKYKKRLAKSGGAIKFPLFKSVDYHLQNFYIQDFKDILHINGLSGFVTNNGLIKLLQDDQFNKDLVKQRLEKILKKEQSLFQQYSKSYIQKFLQKVVDDVNDFNIVNVVIDREEDHDPNRIKSVLLDLGRYPAAFHRNQRLLSNRLSSLFQLKAVQKEIQNEFDHSSEELIEALSSENSHLVDEVEKCVDLDSSVYLEKERMFPVSNMVNAFSSKIVAKIGEVIQLLPDEVDVIGPESLNNFEKNQEDVKTSVISFRKTVSFALERDYSKPLTQSMEYIYVAEKAAVDDVNKVLKLLQFNYLNENALPKDVEEVKAQLQSKLDNYRKVVAENQSRIRAEKETSFDRLGTVLDIEVLLNRTNFSQSSFMKDKAYDQGNKYLERTRFGLSKLDQKIDDTFIKLRDTVSKSSYEYRTKSLLNLQNRLGAFVSQVELGSEVSSQIPYYYQQLFTGKQIAPEAPLKHRELELSLANGAVQKWKEGRNGVILFTGEGMSGKSFVKQNFINGLAINSVIRIERSKGKKQTFLGVLQKATGIYKSVDEIFSSLERGSVLDISDLELFWDADEEGKGQFAELLEVFSRFHGKILFVVDCNIHFYNYAKFTFSLDNVILSSVVVRPLSTTDIKEIILERHYAGGMKFFWSGKHEEDTKLRSLNRIFTKIKENNLGNVGSAMHYWIGAVQRVENNVLVLNKLDADEITFEIKPEWELMLYQVLIRKNIKLNLLKELFSEGVNSAEAEVDNLLRSNLLMVNLSGEVEINPYALIFVVKYLRKNQIIL